MKTIVKENFPNNAVISKVLEEMLQKYSNPSFGSMSKRDIDLLMFTALQDLGIIDSNPQIYDVVRLLHITRSKARNLIYESTLRRQEADKMDAYLKKELERVIVQPKFLKEGDKICIEIDNPLLIDYIRQQLRDLGHITDGSFSSELVKMTSNAFTDLYVSILSDANLSNIKAKFVALGLERDKTPKAIVKQVLMSICRIVLGRAGEALAGSACEALKQWMAGQFDDIPADVEDLPGTIYSGINIA